MSIVDSPIFSPSANQGLRVHRYTTEEYEALIESGGLPESAAYELIEGVVVDKDRSDFGGNPMGIGEKHNCAVQLLAAVSFNLKPLGFYMNSQGPLVLSGASIPEPDGCILRGSPRDYRKSKPAIEDVEVVFEVADSSLDTDRGLKLRLYSAAGITHYVIVNLRDNVIEYYTRGIAGLTFREAIGPGSSLVLTLSSGQEFAIPADDLLPGAE